MDSRTYWEKRAKENELRVFQYAGKRAQLVTRWFSQAQKEMQQRVDDFYRLYAKDGRISLREAKHAIADRRTISLTLEEARRLGSLYPDDAEMTRLLRKQYIQRAVSREELLCMQLQLLAGELYGRYAAETTRSLTEIFEESYYRTLYGFQKFTGYGTHFNRLNTHQIEAAVNTAWSGKNYSERIWGGQRGALARNLDRIITTGVIQGRPQGGMAAQLRKAMDISAYNARRLIRTECTAVAGKANLAGYQENGTGQFEFVATLDNRTSARCRGMDGKHFYVKDGKIGVNIPPLHPFCRSTTVPYVPDARFDLDDTRAARSGTGETYSVPGGMAYKEWHRKYVGTSPDKLLSEHKVQNGYADAAQFERYTKVLGKDAPKSLDGFQRIKYTEPNTYLFLKLDYKRRRHLLEHPELALPNAKQAAAAEPKFTRYLFDPKSKDGWPKGQAILSRFGYSIDNWEDFRKDILSRAGLYPVKLKRQDAYGDSYEQKMVIYGLKGKPGNVLIGWKVSDGRTWMTTAFLKELGDDGY